MHGVAVLLGAVLAALPAQAAAQAADSARTDTASGTPLAPPPPLPATPEQERYLRGLRTAGRGVAQLKDGVDRVLRTQSGSDTLRQIQAGKRLAGLCTAARGFMVSGRAGMKPTAYEDSTRIHARLLAVRIDSLIGFTPSCERGAGKAPGPLANDLLARLRSYETALRAFRAAIGLPNR